MRKRFLALVLVVCLVVSGCPLKAFATEQPTTLTEPKVTGLSVSINDGDPVDILSGQSAIEMVAGSKPVFTVTFDDTAMVSQVFVTSSKDGETKYLEAKPENGKYVTDGYFDPTNEEYIPGTIRVEYSKKSVVIDENRQVDGLDTSTLKSQLSAQGVSVQNRTQSNGEVTAQIVLKDMAGEMSDVFFDAAVSEFNASAGIDESELKKWLGVYQDLSELPSYDFEGQGGKKFILYLTDKDYGDGDTYLLLLRDVTSNKYTKTLITKAGNSLGLDGISDLISQANFASKALLDYRAITKDIAALREEIDMRVDMSQQEKLEANEKITALDRDKKLFLMGMTALPLILVSAGGTPLMIGALIAGYSSVADYFWQYRIGLITGCEPVSGAFKTGSAHGGIPLDEEHIEAEFDRGSVSWSLRVLNNGNYYIPKNEHWQNHYIYIGGFSGAGFGNPVNVTICTHGDYFYNQIDVNHNSVCHVHDCTYKKDDYGNYKNTFNAAQDSKVIIENASVIAHSYDGGEVIVNSGTLHLSTSNGGKATINGGLIPSCIGVGEQGFLTVNEGNVCAISNSGTATLVNGIVDTNFWDNRIMLSKPKYGVFNYKGGKMTVSGGSIAGGIINYDGSALTISNGKIDGGVFYNKYYKSEPTILLINRNSDIEVIGNTETFSDYGFSNIAFERAPVVQADIGYTGGIVYYSSPTAQGVPMTIEEAAKIDFTLPYVRIVANPDSSSTSTPKPATPTPTPTPTSNPKPTNTPTSKPTLTSQPTDSPSPSSSPTPIPGTWENPFPDVNGNEWFIKALEYVAKEGLMHGYDNGKFGASDSLTRSEFAQIIYNKEGRPAVTGGKFTDIKDGQWYANAVNWATGKGIVAGIGNNMFAPNNPITREQLATMLWRYEGCPEPKKSELNFKDTDKISKYAWKAMLWANENGIINGKGNGILDPNGKATRAEAAQMLMNYLDR